MNNVLCIFTRIRKTVQHHSCIIIFNLRVYWLPLSLSENVTKFTIDITSLQRGRWLRYTASHLHREKSPSSSLVSATATTTREPKATHGLDNTLKLHNASNKLPTVETTFHLSSRMRSFPGDPLTVADTTNNLKIFR